MTTHKIKLSHCFFDDVASGHKNFELRKNDRHYQVGDCVLGIENVRKEG